MRVARSWLLNVMAEYVEVVTIAHVDCNSLLGLRSGDRVRRAIARPTRAMFGLACLDVAFGSAPWREIGASRRGLSGIDKAVAISDAWERRCFLL